MEHCAQIPNDLTEDVSAVSSKINIASAFAVNELPNDNGIGHINKDAL